MLPAALFGLQALPGYLTSLWQQMKQTATKLTALVPGDLYLPAPAVYCPQPSYDKEVLIKLAFMFMFIVVVTCSYLSIDFMSEGADVSRVRE